MTVKLMMQGMNIMRQGMNIVIFQKFGLILLLPLFYVVLLEYMYF